MPQKKVVEFAMLNPDAAGVDIGSKEHWVAVPEGKDEQPIRRFGSFTEDLHAIAAWLKQCAIKTVAMESTGVYWIPLFLVLEEYGFEVYLVNAKHVKNVSGKKTDEKDCRWIQRLHSCGLLTASFQPDLKTRELRSYIRHKQNLIQSASTHVLRMQKAFEQMNIKLHHVITDITGKTGTKIIEAILAGQRDATELAKNADARVHPSKKEFIIKSLQGNWREEHLFELKQSYELYRFYQAKIWECDIEIQKIVSRYGVPENKNIANESQESGNKKKKESAEAQYLRTIFGVDVTEIWGIKENMAIELLSEIGMDMSKWPTEKHFVSWLGLAPNTKVSGGKIISSKIPKKQNKAGQLFRMIAYVIQRSDHWLAVFYRRMRAKGGPKKAIVATARKLAIIFYKMVKNKEGFKPIDLEVYQQQYKEQKIKWLEKQALRLGGTLTFS
jgi:transposase